MKYKRRKFLKKILYSISIPAFILFDRAARNTDKAKRGELIKVNISDLTEGLNQFDKVFILKENSKIKAFSRSCTHLGCTVEKKSGQLVCPCHGSKYDVNGEVVKGPAGENLHAIDIKQENGIIRIYV